jgi:hypothetical protein
VKTLERADNVDGEVKEDDDGILEAAKVGDDEAEDVDVGEGDANAAVVGGDVGEDVDVD